MIHLPLVVIPLERRRKSKASPTSEKGGGKNKRAVIMLNDCGAQLPNTICSQGTSEIRDEKAQKGFSTILPIQQDCFHIIKVLFITGQSQQHHSCGNSYFVIFFFFLRTDFFFTYFG